MPNDKIHVVGNEETVQLFGLLGIDGTILKKSEDFVKEFKDLVTQTTIGMIIVALDLPEENIDFLVDFKLNTRRPFVFYLPDIFQPNIENEDPFLRKIYDSINKIIS